MPPINFSETKARATLLRTRVTITIYVSTAVFVLYLLGLEARGFSIKRHLIALSGPYLLAAVLIGVWAPKRFAVPFLIVAISTWIVVPFIGTLVGFRNTILLTAVSLPLGTIAGLVIAAAEPKRAWMRFNLRTLLGVVVFCCVVFAGLDQFMGKPVRDQARAIAEIQKLGGRITTERWGAPWLGTVFGEHYFLEVTSVSVTPNAADETLRLLPQLAGVKGLETVRTISLDSTVSPEALANIGLCEKLKELSFSSNTDVSDDGLRHLAGCSELEELDVSWCPRVTDASVPLFKKFKHLQELRLARTAVTREGLHELTRALPHCKVWPFVWPAPPRTQKDLLDERDEPNHDALPRSAP